MNIQDAMVRCKAIETAVAAKGFNQHSTCTLSVNWLSYKPYALRIDFRDAADDRTDLAVSGTDCEAVFAELEAQVDAFPDRHQQLARDFIGRRARLTEDARELEIPIAVDLDAMLKVCRTTLLEAR
jgi:hypothetical protein